MFRSAQYLVFVRSHPCVAPGCRKPADEAHHFGRASGGGGEAIKAHDTYTVPLCVDHHRAVHSYGYLRPWGKTETLELFLESALRLLTEYWIERKAKRATKGGAAAEAF